MLSGIRPLLYRDHRSLFARTRLTQSSTSRLVSGVPVDQVRCFSVMVTERPSGAYTGGSAALPATSSARAPEELLYRYSGTNSWLRRPS